MKDSKINTLIECLYSNNMIPKKYKFFFQEQYEYLYNDELLKRMGIAVEKDNLKNKNNGFVIDKNNNIKHYSTITENEIRCAYIITNFDFNKFKLFRNNNILRIVLSFINQNKMYILSGIVLHIIMILITYLIMRNLTTIIDTAIIIRSKYIFETCALIGFAALVIYCLILTVYRYICNLISKNVLIDKIVYIEDENNPTVKTNILINLDYYLQSFSINIISVLSLIPIIIILYYFGSTVLKFALIHLAIMIFINIIYMISLKNLGFYNYVKYNIRANNNVSNTTKLRFTKVYKKREKLCIYFFRLIFLLLLFETYMYLSYQIFNDTLSLGMMIFDLVFVFLLIYPFYDILCNIPNYSLLLIFMRENKLKEMLNEKKDNENSIVFIESPNLLIDNLKFGYDEHYVLNNVNLEINKDSIIEIIGNPGSGKKTLAKLMINHIPYEHGDILIDGISVKQLNKYTLEQIFEYVSFCDDFIDISVKDYLLTGNSYSEKDFDSLINELTFLDFLKNYPDYTDTVFNKKHDLSNSEIGLILIAKAIFNDKKIIILDNLLYFMNDYHLDKLMNVISKMDIKFIVLENQFKKHDKIKKYYMLNNGELREEKI